MSIRRNDLNSFLNELLNPSAYNDYGPNGLQIEGTQEIQKIAFAVSATLDSITKAVNWGADTLIVHHGLFWKFHGARTLRGPFAKRIFPLVRNNMNLFGHHLPLDGHPIIGNAASIAHQLDLEDWQPFGEHEGSPVGIKGKFKKKITSIEVKCRLEKILDHSVIAATPDENQILRSIGIITGGASSMWKEASKAHLDSYLTGEISEHDWHESKESGIHMFAGGHNATEKFGIQNVMREIEKNFPVTCLFIPSDNPA